MSTEPKLDIDAVQAEVEEWTGRFRIDGQGSNPMADGLIIAEEAGEVCRAILKRAHGNRPDTDWDAQLYDEIGDVAIALMSLCANEGFLLSEVIECRWTEVSQR